jgi:hypothetical protein
MAALEDYCGYIADRMNGYIRNAIRNPLFVRVWEYQDRGALHLNYGLIVPVAQAYKFIPQRLKKQWIGVLREVGKRGGTNMLESLSGGIAEENDIRISIDPYPLTYLAKYNQKYPRTRRDGTSVGPGRWFAISKELKNKIQEMTVVEQIPAQSFDELVRLRNILCARIDQDDKPKSIRNPFNEEIMGEQWKASSLQQANIVIQEVADVQRKNVESLLESPISDVATMK